VCVCECVPACVYECLCVSVCDERTKILSAADSHLVLFGVSTRQDVSLCVSVLNNRVL